MPSSERSLFYYANGPLLDESNHHLSGVRRYVDILKLFDVNFCPVDRTETIRLPVRTAVWAPLPAYRKTTTSYETLCNERAVELMSHAERLELPLYVLYSGGIDSTLVLVSLIKNATPKQLERVIVLLTQESIAEYPKFFDEHIIGKLKIRPASIYPFLLGKRGVFVCGELNDQVMGSELIALLATKLGNDKIHAPYGRDTFVKLWAPAVGGDVAVVHAFLDQFERLKAACPVALETNADFLWWINFALKWQSVIFRIVSYASTHNLPSIDATFMTSHFFGYFGTEGFQLWAMNNLDKKIEGTWESYKFVAKDVIYEFTKDDDYRRYKRKQGSLYWVLRHQRQRPFITDDYVLHPAGSLRPEDWYDPRNSFR
jgi:hypothetical protein